MLDSVPILFALLYKHTGQCPVVLCCPYTVARNEGIITWTKEVTRLTNSSEQYVPSNHPHLRLTQPGRCSLSCRESKGLMRWWLSRSSHLITIITAWAIPRTHLSKGEHWLLWLGQGTQKNIKKCHNGLQYHWKVEEKLGNTKMILAFVTYLHPEN